MGCSISARISTAAAGSVGTVGEKGSSHTRPARIASELKTAKALAANPQVALTELRPASYSPGAAAGRDKHQAQG